MIYLERGITRLSHPERGNWIVSLQTICAAHDVYRGDYSPNFGPKTEKATKKAQRLLGLTPDGEVGKDTLLALIQRWGWDPPDSLLLAALATGDLGQSMVDMLIDSDVAARSIHPEPGLLPGWHDPAWPQPLDADHDGRSDLTYLKESERQRLFGPLTFRVIEGGKGRVDVDDEWEARSVCTVVLPQIVGKTSYGKKMKSGKVRFHRLVVPQLLGAFQEIEDAGLLGFVLTWGGSFVARLIRGSTTTLSNHALAVAFDINPEWNGLGAQPAMVGIKGQVRSLVAILESWGFFWGGFYRNRKDGMHFEAVRVLSRAELEPKVAALSRRDHIDPWLPAAA